MFDNPSKIQWIKHYKGRMDDLNDVSVTLGFDGKNCLGRMIFLRSKVKFDLLGKINGEEIQLVEMDEHEKVSGTLRGQFSPSSIQLNWASFDKSKGGFLSLTEISKEVKFPSFCGDNKWIRKYSGKIGEEQAELILQKENHQKLSGLIFYQRKNISYAVNGKINHTDSFEIQIKEQTGKVVQVINGNLFQDQITIIHNDTKTTLSPTQGLTIGCIEYVDYMTGYDITFPKTTNASFNQRMEEETNAWIKACRNRATQVKRENNSVHPTMRSTERGFAWSEVSFFSKKLISGFMTFSNTWTPGQKLIAFNYDFEKNSTIYLEDIFSKNKDYKKFIKNFIKKEIKKHQYYSNSDFRKWIKKSDFPYFTIRKDGICFSTKFSMLYGKQSVTIPFRQLKPFLKKNFLQLLNDN